MGLAGPGQLYFYSIARFQQKIPTLTKFYHNEEKTQQRKLRNKQKSGQGQTAFTLL
jgi:hypothetical protein